jgi:H+/Cl- antiporter ClcA
MNKHTAQTQKRPLKPALIVLAVATTCFIVGGGWHFLNPHDDLIYGLYYNAHSSDEIDFANRSLLLFCGPLAGLAGGIVAIAIIFVRRRLRKKLRKD